jgi:hypothetical protein
MLSTRTLLEYALIAALIGSTIWIGLYGWSEIPPL